MLFKLLAQHYIDDQLLEEGTLVGDGQTVSFKYPDGTYRPPTYQMEDLTLTQRPLLPRFSRCPPSTRRLLPCRLSQQGWTMRPSRRSL